MREMDFEGGEPGAREPEGALEILAYIAVKAGAALLALIALSVTLIAALPSGSLPGVLWLAAGGLAMIVVAVRLYFVRRWAAIALPLVIGAIIVADLQTLPVAFIILMAAGNLALILAIFLIRRVLRSGF